jgi:hypothetical protein
MTCVESVKGRPPLEPRIKTLEDRVAALEAKLKQKTPLEEYMSVHPGYKPNFDKWRPNGG